jgi:hypothetical protein
MGCVLVPTSLPCATPSQGGPQPRDRIWWAMAALMAVMAASAVFFVVLGVLTVVDGQTVGLVLLLPTWIVLRIVLRGAAVLDLPRRRGPPQQSSATPGF